MSKDDWLKFFMDAGIPQKDALGYAVKFAHNRIQINMLPELNKEYLKEMDITILGDVISILRHAKIVHEKRTKEKVLLENSSLSSKTNGSSKVGLEEREKSTSATKKKTTSTSADVPKPILKSTVKSVGVVSGRSSLRRKVSDDEEDVPSVRKRTRIESPRKKINNIPLSVEEEEIEEFEDMGYIFGPLSPEHHDIIENRNDSRNKRFKLSGNSGNLLSVPSLKRHHENGSGNNEKIESASGGNSSTTGKMVISKTVNSSNIGSVKSAAIECCDNSKPSNRRTIIGVSSASAIPTTNVAPSITTAITATTAAAVAATTMATVPTAAAAANNTVNREEKPNKNRNDDDDDDDDYEDDDDDDDHIQVIIDDPYFPYYDMRAQLNFNRMEKHHQFKEVVAKKKVFERLGEETSQNSVTSTTTGDDDLTTSAEENLSQDGTSVVSQNSVFFRLGDKNDSLHNQLSTVEEFRAQITEDEEYDVEPITVDSTDLKIDESGNSTECENVDIESSDANSSKYKVHLNMDSEGILANPLNEKKLSLKHRLGYNTKAFRDKQIIDLRKSTLYHKVATFKKDFPPAYMDTEMEKAKKKVKFGKVTQKIIPNKEEAIRNGELPRIPAHRASVFARLGYNVR